MLCFGQHWLEEFANCTPRAVKLDAPLPLQQIPIGIGQFYFTNLQLVNEHKPLKGQCHEIFNFWFFSWISFPQAPEYTIRVVSNFFKNSQRYSQLKVHHRCRWHWWQMEKIFNHKSFKYLFGHLWEVELTYRFIFAFKFTLRSQQPDIVPIIGHRCHWHRCRWYRCAPLTCKYLRKFLKNSKQSFWDTLGLGGNWFMKKNRSKKSRDNVPLLLRLNGINRRNIKSFRTRHDSFLSLDLSIPVWKGTERCPSNDRILSKSSRPDFSSRSWKLEVCSILRKNAYTVLVQNWISISRTSLLPRSYWEVFPDLSGSTRASPKGVWSLSTNLTLNRIPSII